MNEIMRALANGSSPGEAVDRELLRFHVARRVTCAINRTVLDLKRSVLVQIGTDISVVSAQAWDEFGAQTLSLCAELGTTPKIVDARLMVWGDRARDYEELGVYRDVLNKFAGDEAFARWCANRYPWGAFDLRHEREAYELLHQYADGDAVRLRWNWEDLPKGTTGRIVGSPYELYGQPISPMQFIELPDRRRVVVPLAHLTENTDRKDAADGDETR